ALRGASAALLCSTLAVVRPDRYQRVCAQDLFVVLRDAGAGVEWATLPHPVPCVRRRCAPGFNACLDAVGAFAVAGAIRRHAALLFVCAVPRDTPHTAICCLAPSRRGPALDHRQA